MENNVALSDFLNGYTSVSLYSRYSFCSYSVGVAQKTVTCCTKNYVVSAKKIFHIEVTLHTKIMWVTKKYVVATKKICDSCWVNMLRVA